MNSPTYTLRASEPGDGELLWRIQRTAMCSVEGVAFDGSDENRVSYLKAHAAKFGPDAVPAIRPMLIIRDGLAIGRVRTEPREDCVYLAGLQIVPEHQGQGIGGAVVQTIIDQASQAGLPVTVKVDKPNRARKFYERLGFVVTGEEGNRFLMTCYPSNQ